METVVVQSLNALVAIGLLLIMSLGLNLLFGVLNVINFAHGAFFALGGFLLITVSRALGGFPGNVWLGILAAPIIMAVIALPIERTIIRPILSRPMSVSLLATYALTLVIDEASRMIWGAVPISVNAPLGLEGSVSVLGATFPVYRLFIIFISALVAVGLLIFLDKTKIGLCIKASSEDRLMSSCVGINIKRLFTITFALGLAMAAIAGAVAAPVYNVYPGAGEIVIIDAFVVLVMGGLGSIRGTMAASGIVGLVRTIGSVFIAQWSIAMVFAALIIVLLVRPRGIFNEGRMI